MRPFLLSAAGTMPAATAALAAGAQIVAGSTDLLQLLQENVSHPQHLVDISRLPLAGIEEQADGAIRIGALARLQDVADHPLIRGRHAAVAEALDATASPMVRHMATVGGNLLQRTRCLYFRDAATPCNKREPGSGCPAQDGENRINAILGGSEHCIAVQPSDLPVALITAEAELVIRTAEGDERRVAVEAFHRLPDGTPEIDTVLEPGELILAIHLPAPPAGWRSHYVKVRDRASFSWALASAAVALRMDADGTVQDSRIAAGGVATKPWRLEQVEKALAGRPLSHEGIRSAAELAADGAAPRTGNAYKVPLLRNTVERALLELGGLA